MKSLPRGTDRGKALIIGFLSTAGDVESVRIARQWLAEAGITSDVAPYGPGIRALLPGSLDPAGVNPRNYRYLLVVCGPCWKQLFRSRKIDLHRFDHCVKIGLNLSMIDPVSRWNPFDVLLERDSDRIARPDLTFLGAPAGTPPVIGRCIIEQQREYGSRQRHKTAHQLMDTLIARRGFGVVDIDTRCIGRSGHVRTSENVLAVMSRVDFVLTTRLHGMVYSLKAGKPVIAIDPIAGGEKVSAQARAIGWPRCATIEEVTAEWLDEAADWCLTSEAAQAVEECRTRIASTIAKLKSEFLAALSFQKSAPSAKPRLLPRLFWR